MSRRLPATITCAIAAVLASCFIKPDPPGVGGDGSPMMDASTDAHSDAAVQFDCIRHSVSIHYPGMTLADCGAWATTPTGGPIGTNGGPLMIETQLGNTSACASRTTGTGGAISVVAVPGMPNDVAFLQAKTSGGQITSIQFSIDATSAMLELSGASGPMTRPYDPAGSRWWRLRAAAPHAVVGEVSADGMSWTMFGSESTGSESATSLTMSFGVTSATMGSAALDDYVECE